MPKYPTPWQQKTMWAALTALFVLFLVLIFCSVIWVATSVISFLQPILGRTKAVALLFVVCFLFLAALVTWLAPSISMQSASFAKELPSYTQKASDRVVRPTV